MITSQIRIPESHADDWAWAAEEARRRGISRNALLLEALREKRERRASPPPARPAPPTTDDDTLDF